MSRIFLVNCTVQNQQVYYRTDYSYDANGNKLEGRILPPKFVDIPPGSQVPFGPEFFPGQIDEIIQQLEAAGAVNIKTVHTAKMKGRVKFIWSLDKEVHRAVCEDVKLHNISAMTLEGEVRRRQLAITADRQLRNAADEIGAAEAPAMSMEFETVGKSDAEVSAPRFEEGFEVATKSRPRGGSRRSR